MKLKTQKIIAREVLFLAFCFLLGIVTFLCTYFYNFHKRNQVDDLSSKIESKENIADSLSKSFEIKSQNQKWFYEKMSQKYELGMLNTIDLWWEHSVHLANTDSIKERWITIWSKASDPIPFFNKIGFNTPDSLQNFIKANIMGNTDVKNNQTAVEIKEEISLFEKQKKEKQLSILTSDNQLSFGYFSFLISIFILFILRYCYYALKWSISTLHKKDGNNFK